MDNTSEGINSNETLKCDIRKDGLKDGQTGIKNEIVIQKSCSKVFDQAIQPWPIAIKRFLNIPYVNEGNLIGQNPHLKYF